MSRRTLVCLALATAVGVGIAVWQLEDGAAAQPSFPVVKAFREDLTVSVGGVGRIIEAKTPGQIGIGSASAIVGSAPRAASVAAGGGSAPGDAVFPRASGHVARLLVAPGERVAAGRPLAILDDGGAAAATVDQAQADLTTALLELRQRQISGPMEVAAARLAVASARERLARLLAGPRPADVAAARLDVKRAKADLETLRGGTPAARARSISIARANVQVAQRRLARLLKPDAADVSAANAEVRRTEGDLAGLLKASLPSSPEAVAAAEQALKVAQEKLDRLTGPPDPVAVAAAQQEVKKAEADLDLLMRRDTPPVSLREIQAGQAAVETARLKLAKVLGPPDPTEVDAAKLELDRVQAELAALKRPSTAPTSQAIAAAEQAVAAARLKRARLLKPAIADVAAAHLDVRRALSDLRILEAGPTPAGLAAARQAVATSRTKLAQLVGAPPQSDVTAAQLDVGRAEVELAGVRARGGPGSPLDLAVARLKVKAAQARLAGALDAGRLLTVRAPWAGTVTALLTVPGAPVDVSTPIATVADLDHLAVSVDMSEFDAAKVRQGLRALVSVDALGGKTFLGKVLFAAPVGNDSNGVVTFPVRVSLSHAHGVRPGMNVSVHVIVAERREVVQVPLEAVTHDDEDHSIVTVLNASGKTLPRQVTLGLTNNKNVEVVRGLHAGERVLLATSGGGEE